MLSTTATILPVCFNPTEHHIIIGRGRATKMHSGNRKFEKTIAVVAREYAAAPCKAEKGTILTQLITAIHQEGPDAGFVRKDSSTGRWTLVEETLARQTAAQAIRNFLHGDYRSSKQFKQKRRIEQIQKQNSSSSLASAGSSSSNTAASSLLRTVSDESLNLPATNATYEKDTFTLLCAAFATRINPMDNPFQPRPLAPSLDALHNNVFNFEPLV